MPIIEAIMKIGSWLITSLSGILAGVKAFTEVKKFIEKDVMPDIKVEDKAEEIVKKREIAHELVLFTGIEAAYNIARGLIVALNFALLMHYALKAASQLRGSMQGSEEEATHD